MAGYFQTVMDYLTGGGGEASPSKPNLAPPLTSYPSKDDADYARQYGFSDKNINESYLNNQMAHVLGHTMDLNDYKNIKKGAKPLPKYFVPDPATRIGSLTGVSEAFNDPTRSANVDLTDPANAKLKGTLNDVMMRGALAANRIPLAALGFDPTHTMMDAAIGNKANIAGFYTPNNDVSYANTTEVDPSSLVHESMHRGMQKLREAHPQEMKQLANQLPNEEMIVRYLMQSQAGDPENQPDQNVDQKQRQDAINLFSSQKYPNMAPEYQGGLNQIQELAINDMKNRSRRFGPQ